MEIFENLSASSRLEEAELDAYSRAVRDVTERLEPAVISVGLPDGRGGGSGVILGLEGDSATAITNSHVVRGLRSRRAGNLGGDIQVTSRMGHRFRQRCSATIRRAISPSSASTPRRSPRSPRWETRGIS